MGFGQVSCSSNIANHDYLSDWSGGDEAVTMIGGGGSSCARADHRIGITDANEAQFESSTNQGCSGSDVRDIW